MIPREELLQIRRLASRANQRIKDWSCLGDGSKRDEMGLTIAEGAKLAWEGLCAPNMGFFKPAALLISDSGSERPGAAALFQKAGELKLDRFSLSDDVYAKVSGMKNADGLALLMTFQKDVLLTSEQISQPGAKWLVAAGVQDPGNAGALARTALAAGCTGCIFVDGADPRSPKFLRGSMGSAFRFPCYSSTLNAFVPLWRKSSVPLLTATAEQDATDYRCIDYRIPMALLVGGERGIPETLAALPGKSVHIPLAGGVESLNLAVAAGIILFEAAKISSQ